MNDLRPSPSLSRRRVYLLGALAPMLALGLLLLPGQERLRAAGPANTGHEQIACAQCHTPAEGTARQQIQANVRHLAGLRETGADFVHREVSNQDCVACHDNQDDLHAPYRFNEPRFAEVRATLAPQLCVSCHAEHNGRRVTVEPTFCGSCHADLEVRQDSIRPSHAALVSQERWGTCLSCHDYHGNHVRETPRRLDAGATEAGVARYLAGGPAIYGSRFRFPAKTERETP